MKLKKRDGIMLSALLVGALLLAAALCAGRAAGTTVVVSVAGERVAVFSQEKDTTYCIEGVNDSKNELVIENGTVYLREASCPDKLCVHQGSISYVGQSVICLPNQVTVTIAGQSGKKEPLDAVTS